MAPCSKLLLLKNPEINYIFLVTNNSTEGSISMSKLSTPPPPTQAVILAGGKGTRLLPLTETTPKPMIVFHGKPFLEYLLESLRGQGIQRVLLLLGYLPDQVIDYFGDGSQFELEITYNISPVEDETGMRMKRAVDKIDDVFFFLYCDNYLPFSMEDMWRVYSQENVPALVTVYDNKDGYTKNNIRIGKTGRVEIYDKTRTAENLLGVDLGYMIMRRDLLNLMPEGNVSFEKTVYPQLVEKNQLHAYVNNHRYYSVGDFRRMPMTESFLARHPAVLIDRDGVLNEKMPKGEYVQSWSDWKWIDGALEALRMYHKAGYRVFLISNQAGIARGVMSENDLEDIHSNMKKEVIDAGGEITGIYFCPHHWDENCDCRKPKPGMLFQAQKDHHLDLSRIIFIGDDDRDGEAAEAAQMSWKKVGEQKSLLDIARQMIS